MSVIFRAVTARHPFSFDEILRNVDPAPDEDTESFVAAIYADRRQAAEAPPLQMNQIVVDTDVASYIFNWHSLAKQYANALRGSD